MNHGAEPKNLLYYCDLKNEPEEKIAGEILASHVDYPSTLNQFHCVNSYPYDNWSNENQMSILVSFQYCGVLVQYMQWKLSLRAKMRWNLSTGGLYTEIP